jgi:hypothetical protein
MVKVAFEFRNSRGSHPAYSRHPILVSPSTHSGITIGNFSPGLRYSHRILRINLNTHFFTPLAASASFLGEAGKHRFAEGVENALKRHQTNDSSGASSMFARRHADNDDLSKLGERLKMTN